ncbi:mechanosensitive ion channel [Rhodobacteraceae bacterium 2CG4]|uniref:Small-conductance mechanosensitive channel n=1 Tax=Halovulum marinum TaxID=2662447 RepID=A0A6L5Z4T0_9RHOB|nr:mechanosensitive ion channel family protein [Halovulum marinum]MSU91034.1 mechanosensitive ion channel [Halovulum marinum]
MFSSLLATQPFLVKLAIFCVAAALFWFAVVVARTRYLRKVGDPHARRTIRRTVDLALLAIIAIAAAFTFSQRLGGLALSLGVAGAAVAFALQQVLASGVAFIQIMTNRVYRTGDRVKVGGVIGDVIQINVFLTTLMEIRGDWVDGDQYTGRVVRVPNAAIYQQPVFNYSADYEFLWDELKVPVRYGGDRKLAVQIMMDAVSPLVAQATETMKREWHQLKEDYAIEDASLEPQVFLVANDNWLEYSIRYLVDYKQRRSTKSALCEAIVAAFEAHSEKVGFASGTYDIVGLPPLKVDLVSSRAGEKT